MGGILKYFFDLKYFWEVLFDSVSEVEGLVPIAGDFEHFVVDLVLDGGDVGHFDVGDRLFEHNSFIMLMKVIIIVLKYKISVLIICSNSR